MKNRGQKGFKKMTTETISRRSIGSKPSGADKILKIASCIFLVALTFAVYGQVQDREFLNLDDPVYVSQNPKIQAGFSLESVG